MQIPFTLNACAVALAYLGRHVLTGDERAQVTGEYPVDGMAAFIALNDEHASIEATFLLPGWSPKNPRFWCSAMRRRCPLSGCAGSSFMRTG